jgi:hypothetical protein
MQTRLDIESLLDIGHAGDTAPMAHEIYTSMPARRGRRANAQQLALF